MNYNKKNYTMIHKPTRLLGICLGNSVALQLALQRNCGTRILGFEPWLEGLNGVNRQPSNDQKSNRQSSIKPGISNRQVS